MEIAVARTGEAPADRLPRLAQEVVSLTRALAEVERTKGRDILVKSFKSKLATVLAEMQELQKPMAGSE